MTIRFATKTEIANWDEHILDNPDGGNIFQSYLLTEFKSRTGWQAIYLVVDNFKDDKKLFMSVQQKYLPLLGKFWYISKGPGINNLDNLATLISKLTKFAKRQGVFVVKIEPEIIKNDQSLAQFDTLNLHSVREIQPNASTVVLDISPSEDEILAAMPRKGAKYAINRARRDGAVVERVAATDENCRIFYDLLSNTAKNSKFTVRSAEYYKDFWQAFSANHLGQMFFAYFEDKVVAAAFGLIYGEKSTYKDGASVIDRQAYGASHLLQWEVILWARENKAKTHDLCGAPPSDQISNQNHRLYGIGKFKTSFSRQVTDYVGAFDIAIKPAKYKIWTNFGERVALKIHRKLRQESWY